MVLWIATDRLLCGRRRTDFPESRRFPNTASFSSRIAYYKMSSPNEPDVVAAVGNKRPRTDDDDGNAQPASASAGATADTSSSSDPKEPQLNVITEDGEMPQKKFYRSRAHVNPLSHNNAYDYPTKPELLDWSVDHYPNHPSLKADDSNNTTSKSTTNSNTAKVAPNVLDIGCGFGGLTIALSTLLPTSTILGLEIRDKVTEYVRLRIAALRKDHPGQYQNASVLRSNTMKFMPNLFAQQSLDKVFFCFPDPHFKRKNHPRRIVSERLLSEYAYFLKPGTGRLYCITDVEELHQWHLSKCRAHPLFRELTQEEIDEDPCVEAMRVETEEGKKVERAGAAKYYAVYQRLDEDDDRVKDVTAENFFTECEFGASEVEKK